MRNILLIAVIALTGFAFSGCSSSHPGRGHAYGRSNNKHKGGGADVDLKLNKGGAKIKVK